MTKLFKEDIQGEQEAPLKLLQTLFAFFASAPEEAQKKSNRWILVLSGKNEEGLSWQVAYQNIIAPNNLVYHIFIYDAENKLLSHVPVEAVQMLPPVSEKTFGLDYFDWLEIQGTIFKWLSQNKYKVFNIDMNAEGKVVYQTKETPEEAIEKMKKGEQYTIVAIKAQVFLDKIKEWKKQQLEKEENKNLIITPEQVAAENAENVKIITPN